MVEVTNVTATYLSWNTTNITPNIFGTCNANIDTNQYAMILIVAYTHLSSGFDLPGIISSGLIAPIYHNTFEFPLFVDPKPQTWLDFDALEDMMEVALPGMFSSWDSCVVDAIYSEVNNKMTFTLMYSTTHTFDVSTNYALESTSSFSYNMTTGALLEADYHYSFTGSHTDAPFAVYSDYSIEQTEVPSNLTPNNFLEFLKENKWYFIGGGAGIVVIGATVGIVLGVKKSKGSKKSSKKKSSK